MVSFSRAADAVTPGPGQVEHRLAIIDAGDLHACPLQRIAEQLLLDADPRAEHADS